MPYESTPRLEPASINMIEIWFTYHDTDDPEVIASYTIIREKAKLLAQTILAHTPPGPDQSAAIRKLREAVMTANAAIACAGR
jgi:hypothetical protein